MFIRLFGLLEDRLLYYIETFDIEVYFEKLIKDNCRTVYHRTQGLTKEKYQAWVPLNGDQAYDFIIELLDQKKKVLSKLFFGHEIKDNRIDYNNRYFKAMETAFKRLIDIIDFIRDKHLKMKTVNEFEALVKSFAADLVYFFSKKVARKWYLHLLVNHIPDMLRRHGSILKFSCGPQERVNGIHSRYIH